MKKYAMMVLGDYDTKHDTAEFVHGEMLTRFVTVRDFEEARETAKKLLAEGGRMAIGYCVSDPDMEEKLAEFFG